MLGRFPVGLRRYRGLLRGSCRRGISAMAGGEEGPIGEFLEYMDRLRNYERSGVPRGAGTDSDDGFDLGRMRRLLRRLGDPHTHFPAVHIAGTKGKGSTAAFLSNIMREQGYNVGLYTSPHLLTIRERMSVGKCGGPVSAALLRDLFDQSKEAIDQSIESENGALTHFEVFTALSFLMFSRENVDIAIVEAGLGGARDATNVIQSTELAASVITTVGKEHLAALGGSLQSIAAAKSGIIKEGRPLLGDHQRQNAVTASCTALCLRELGWDISNASIQAGLEKTRLPGRSQFLTQEEASVLGFDGASTILIDGAHTEASAKALSDVVRTVKPEGPLALVIGMANDKEHLAFAEQLLSGTRAGIVLLTEASIDGGNSRSMPAASLKEIWIAAAHDQGIDYVDIGTITGAETPERIDHPAAGSSSSDKPTLIGCQNAPFSCDLTKVASQLLRSRADGAPGLVCVTGSLHIVSSVLQQLGQH